MSDQVQNPETENQDISQIESDSSIVAQRTLKVRELEAMNINPWGERFDGAEKCAALREKFDPEQSCSPHLFPAESAAADARQPHQTDRQSGGPFLCPG